MKRLITTVGLALTFGAAALAADAPRAWVASIDTPRFDGRPIFRAGFERGYYVWREGHTWRVRWTTAGQPHTFTGHVIAEGGQLHDLDRVVTMIREGFTGRTGLPELPDLRVKSSPIS